MKLLSRLYIALIILFLYAPVAVMIVFSFNSSSSVWVMGGFSTRWYEGLVKNTVMLSALEHTLIIALLSAIISTVLGTAAAVGISLGSSSGSSYSSSDELHVLVKWWVITISWESIINMIFLAMRLFLLVLGTSVLTLTTTPVALTDGIESLLTPLKWIRFPVHELALIMSIALRFIPTLIDETNRIVSAQKARGANFETGGLIKRAKAMIPVLVPLLVSAFRRAEDLGDAMDARCYSGSKGRTKYKKLTFGWRDAIGLLLLAGLITGVVFLNIYFGGKFAILNYFL